MANMGSHLVPPGDEGLAKKVHQVLNQLADACGGNLPETAKACRTAAQCVGVVGGVASGNLWALKDIAAFYRLVAQLPAAAAESRQKLEEVWRELRRLWPIVQNAAAEAWNGVKFNCYCVIDGNNDSFGLGITIPFDFNGAIDYLMKKFSPQSMESGPQVMASAAASVGGVSLGRAVDAALNMVNSDGGCCSINYAGALFGGADSCQPPPRRDPLVLDLNGDGLQTTPLVFGASFDHQGDGFRELSGWVDWGDGLLAMDRNGNGVIDDDKELFSDQTILKTGRRAANGFEALAELDDNKDGKIDAQDAAYSQLKVLKRPFEGDDELVGLSESGITSINVASSADPTVDEWGNIRTRVGDFEKADGSVGEMAEYKFSTYSLYTIPKETLPVPDDIAALPDVRGFGHVYDLQQAMVRDASGELKSLVEHFAAATDAAQRNILVDQILFKWTGGEDIDRQSRGSNFDARKLTVLEKFFTQPFVGSSGPNPTGIAAIALNESYGLLFERVYAHLMVQTHLADLYGHITFIWNEDFHQYQADMSGVVGALQQELTDNPEQGRILLGEFARTFRGSGASREHCLACREIFIQQDPSLGWVIDTGGLPVIDSPGQGLRTWSPHIEGTDNADAILGSLTLGDRYINGLNGDDVIYGTSRDEVIYNETGDSLLAGGGGNDVMYAGADNDILDGGEGNDQLLGETGNDTYLFRRGSGRDTIIDTDATADNVDTIWLGSNLTPDEILLQRSGNNLVLKITDTTDSLTVKDYFRNDSSLNKIEQIQFMDGTVWTESDITDNLRVSTDLDDIVYGTSGDDNLNALGGNDTIYGLAGDDVLLGNTGDDRINAGAGADTLDGGTGTDTLDGGEGSDTYLFTRGSGQDKITETDSTPGSVDTIELGDGIVPTDIKLERIGAGFKLTILDTLDSVTVTNWLENDTPLYGVEAIKFADGTTWDTEAIKQMLTQGTSAEDTIIGFSSSDTIQGFDGNDVLYGRAGDDTLDSGNGNDLIYGEAGNDTLQGADGDDTLLGGANNDTLDGGAGNDILTGGSSVDFQVYLNKDNANGNDTYLFGRGSGQDIIVDHDKVTGNIDTILLGADITPDDIKFERKGDDLELTISGADDRLTVKNYFWNDSTEYRVERIQFADGTVWSIDDLKSDLNQGTSGDDVLIGYSVADSLNGYEGSDKIYGRGGDDVLDGGLGDDAVYGEGGADTILGGEGSDKLAGGSADDIIDGGAGADLLYGGDELDTSRSVGSNGNDTYLFGRGYGQDTIIDYDKTAGNLDTILLNNDVVPADVAIRRTGDNLVLSINGSADTLTVNNWFKDEADTWQVEQVRFADGTTWNVDAIKQMVLEGTPGDDLLLGYSGTSDTIRGYDGADTLYGRAGDDTLEGGAGDDAFSYALAA